MQDHPTAVLFETFHLTGIMEKRYQLTLLVGQPDDTGHTVQKEFFNKQDNSGRPSPFWQRSWRSWAVI